MLSPESIYDSVAEILEELKLINDNDRSFLRSYFINESNTDIVRRLVANTDAEIKRFHIRLFFSKDIDQVFSEIDKLMSSDEEKSTLKQSYSSQLVWEKVFTQLFQKINEQTFSTADLISEIKELFSEKNKDNNAVAKTNNEKELSFSIKDRMDMDVRNILPANEIFISNAGLCLLTPWISSFFKQLNLIEANEFVDAGKQQHAIYLLHYLITQEENPTEELLVLPKLLCGWPLQMPVINSDVITDQEKNECVDLLTSVIQNWTTLKNTSIDGLRGSFLQRSGKLTENEDQFILQPEQQSIDLLLEYVPWTFRYIRLPWMKKALQVDWY